MNDNLSSLLSGKAKSDESPSEVEQVAQDLPPQSSPINTTRTVKSDAVVQAIQVPTTNNKRVNFPVYLKADLLRRFKQAVNADGQKMSSLIVTWIVEYLRQREQYEN